MSTANDSPSTQTGEEPHSHRWRIGAQAGAFSQGVCACGAEKEFPNSWDREPAGRAWSNSGRGAR